MKGLRALNKWWGGKMLSNVNGANCRAYAKWRGNNGGARRDLEDLRAAVNHHSRKDFIGVLFVSCCRKRDCRASDG